MVFGNFVLIFIFYIRLNIRVIYLKIKISDYLIPLTLIALYTYLVVGVVKHYSSENNENETNGKFYSLETIENLENKEVDNVFFDIMYADTVYSQEDHEYLGFIYGRIKFYDQYDFIPSYIKFSGNRKDLEKNILPIIDTAKEHDLLVINSMLMFSDPDNKIYSKIKHIISENYLFYPFFMYEVPDLKNSEYFFLSGNEEYLYEIITDRVPGSQTYYYLPPGTQLRPPK